MLKVSTNDKIYNMELRTRLLFRNAITSKSGLTLADTEVLKNIALRLGYDLKELAYLDNTDVNVNPYLNVERKKND